MVETGARKRGMERPACGPTWSGPSVTFPAFESRVNEVLQRHDIVAVCTYDVGRFSASLVMDVLRTHPYAIIGGTLRENPFYVPPREFLQELQAREAN